MGVSNKITSILNFTALLCSLPHHLRCLRLSDSRCLHFLLGLLVLVVSLLALYLLCMAFLIVVLLVVIKPDGGCIVSGRSYKEYRVEGFSKWMRDYVGDSGNWRRIRACLAESDSCPKLTENYLTADQFFAARISPLQIEPEAARDM